MDTKELIGRLLDAKSGNRELDLQVARLLGWTSKTENDRVLWMVPGADNVTGKVPDYTTNIHAAYQVAQAVAPGHAGGCSWEPGEGTAVIGDGPYISAATPALALLIAALRIKARQV